MIHCSRIEDNKASTLKLLEQYPLRPEQILQTWERFGNEYLLRYTPDELAWHMQEISRHGASNPDPLILLRHSTHRGGTELFIYSLENERTFSHITNVLEQMGLTIVDARILSSDDHYILDTFIILDESGTELTDPFREKDLKKRIFETLRDPEKAIPKPVQHMPRQTKAFAVKTDIQFWDDEKFSRTVMQVFAKDRPGLLSRIARALLECKIQLLNAKIATFGERAEDIFYICDMDGEPIHSSEKREEIRSTIQRHLES